MCMLKMAFLGLLEAITSVYNIISFHKEQDKYIVDPR